jgi:hypothetical protein
MFERQDCKSEQKTQLDTFSLIEPVVRTCHEVRAYFPTLSPSQYNYNKMAHLPSAQTIMAQTELSWDEILRLLGLPRPLDRDTLSRLSQSLHLLEKQIVHALGLSAIWYEHSFAISSHQKLRPDSFYVERAYVHNNQMVLLDVKLSICSSSIAIYHYLPIFEMPPMPCQLTFFPSWLQDTGTEEQQVYADGQMGLFWENNVLYICYLLGKPQKDLLPGSEICFRRERSDKKKKLPDNMEIRFIEFSKLPELYCHFAGIEYQPETVAPMLHMAEKIKEVVLSLPTNAAEISRQIYQKTKKEISCLHPRIATNATGDNILGNK